MQIGSRDGAAASTLSQTLASFLADLESLKTEFARLFATDCRAELTTTRTYWPYRSPDWSLLPPHPGGEQAESLQWCRLVDGLEVEPLWGPTEEGSPDFYDIEGQRIVNANGEPMVRSQGWGNSHAIELHGNGSHRAGETLERADRLAKEMMRFLPDPSLCGRRVRLGAGERPDAVELAASQAKRSLLAPNEWYVYADGQRYSLSVWRKICSHQQSFGPMVPPELIEQVGETPGRVYANRREFLRDSELACEWMIEEISRQLAETEADQEAASSDDAATQPVPKKSKGDTFELWRCALLSHHKHSSRKMNNQPIANKELAKLAVVSTGTSSGFFQEYFGGHRAYCRKCGDVEGLEKMLVLLDGVRAANAARARQANSEDRDREAMTSPQTEATDD